MIQMRLRTPISHLIFLTKLQWMDSSTCKSSAPVFSTISNFPPDIISRMRVPALLVAVMDTAKTCKNGEDDIFCFLDNVPITLTAVLFRNSLGHIAISIAYVWGGYWKRSLVYLIWRGNWMLIYDIRNKNCMVFKTENICISYLSF